MENVALDEDRHYNKYYYYYYKTTGSIQQSMHEREKQRLELERELFAYSLSDKRISQIKCAKLRGYLREICERETRAKRRNLELLRDVESVETDLKERDPDRSSLHQHKAKYLDQISRLMAVRKKKEHKGDFTHKKYPSGPQDSQPPPVVPFAGLHTSAGSGATSAPSRQASRHPPECPPSGLSKDFRIGGEAVAAASRTPLSCDISASNDSPDGSNLRNKHERTEPLAGTAGGSAFIGCDDEQPPSSAVTSTRPKKSASSMSSVSPIWAEDPLAEETEAHRSPIMSNVQSLPETYLGEGAQEVPGEDVSTPSSSPRLSESSSSYLSISLTDSELEDDARPEGVSRRDALPAARVAPTRGDPPAGTGSPSVRSQQSSVCSVVESMSGSQTDGGPQPSEQTSERLSGEGLFHLLESIEGRLRGEQTGSVYSSAAGAESKLHKIISLSNGRAALDGEDLQECGAVVLRELQGLSRSMTGGGLLPLDLLGAPPGPGVQPADVSSSLPPDAARLWDRWFKHALLLKEHRVLGTERLLQLFTPLLLGRHAASRRQAKVLLRTLLSRSSEEGPSAEERSQASSSSSPSQRGLLTPNARPELQSDEEDSQDESPVETLPIREMKAYQLLKQSATREWPQSSGEEEEEEEDPSGINGSGEEDLGRAKRSSHQDPYPRNEKTKEKKKPLSAVQSKAFWGESEDSNSEIEAALRPPPFHASGDDDDDDFFD